MTLGLIFNYFLAKIHLEHFLFFIPNTGFVDKEIQTQKWCNQEKFRGQELRVKKGFFK